MKAAVYEQTVNKPDEGAERDRTIGGSDHKTEPPMNFNPGSFAIFS